AQARVEGEPEHSPIERRGHIHTADVEDPIADALHGHYRTTGCPQTGKLRELQGSRRDYRCSRVLAGGARAGRGAVPGTVGPKEETMGGYLPQVFERFGSDYPAVMEAFGGLAERLHEAGPLSAGEGRVGKLGV